MNQIVGPRVFVLDALTGVAEEVPLAQACEHAGMLVTAATTAPAAWPRLAAHSLDMVAEVPIRDEWIGKGGLLGASLKGQTLKLPIRGTMSKPHVDHGAINQLVRDAVQGAGTRAIEDQLNKGLEKGLKSLDKFLPPRGK